MLKETYTRPVTPLMTRNYNYLREAILTIFYFFYFLKKDYFENLDNEIKK